jgi:hypothetical protein
MTPAVANSHRSGATFVALALTWLGAIRSRDTELRGTRPDRSDQILGMCLSVQNEEGRQTSITRSAEANVEQTQPWAGARGASR